MENVNDVAAAIISEVGEIDAMSLEKLLYYSQAWSLAINGSPLFTDEIQAWRNGPVVPAIYFQHKQKQTVNEWRSGDAERVSSMTRQLVRMIGLEYGHLKGYQLSDLTHAEDPWNEARGDLAKSAPSREAIRHQSMATYFRSGKHLQGWDALDISLAGLLNPEAGTDGLHENNEPATTPVCGNGQRGLSADQLVDVRSRRRPRSRI